MATTIATSFLSSTGFLPEASGQVIEYIRKPKNFPINDYAQYVETPTTNGAYAYVDPDQPVRIVSDAEYAWEDGDARPTGNANLLSYQWIPFRCYRRDYPWTLGNQAVELSKDLNGFDPTVQQAGQVASQAMTNRSNRVVTMLTTASNWGNNTADVNVINGGYGKWNNASSDPTSPGYLAIKRSLGNACKLIRLLTNGMVKRKDLMLVLGLDLAEAMADTSEIYDYVKYGPYSEGAQRGEDRDMDEDGGLPPKLYGIKVKIEDSMLVNTYAQKDSNQLVKPASTTLGQRAYCWPTTKACLVTRVGGIEGGYGSPSFSTVQIYFFGAPMEVEQFADKKNRRIEGHVSETFFEVLAAPASGFLFTNCQ